MITIVHGNDTASSRKFYIEDKAGSSSHVLIDKINYDFIFQSIEGNSLFEESKNIYIENFFSNTKSNSNEFKKIVDYLNSIKKNNIFFWEGKELSKTQQSVFKNVLIKTFSYPSTLFQFLDSLGPQSKRSLSLFKELERSMETELIFYMLIRQFRLLLSVQESSHLIDEAKRLQTWQRSKLQKQSSYFGKEKLQEIYKKLYKIDYQTKFGLTPFNLSSSIDIFLVNL
ncbi:MAG: hypothetical protein A3B38_01525 [Candidatus Levybacteria bacterium RIFCSPLOWO2_01_FULL_36_13]|nr:MAG: hypothetical protein A2684_02760 [Candidatus Levybacteria bacterium RIFCSPHIGHO2_01_FULL_36_15b]OGH35549.1 MAG: hypothetical protein A3B38_01525 [Candidatus Levybacteria bacterium RIFCSPLOWO2_01_FULL_36_13]